MKCFNMGGNTSPEEYQQSEYHEVFHRIAICPALILPIPFCPSEDEGFVGVAKRLRKYHHDYRYLHVASVDTDHGSCRLTHQPEEIGMTS